MTTNKPEEIAWGNSPRKMTEADLLPCPACGNQAGKATKRAAKGFPFVGLWKVSCQRPDCPLAMIYFHPVEWNQLPRIKQSEYEALQAERDQLRRRARAAEREYSKVAQTLKGMERVSKVVSDHSDEVCTENNQLRVECEKLRKDAERPRAAFCAVIEYMLGEGRWEEPMEFLRCWNEGYFDSLREEWPEAPQAIYYADPLADHEAIDAAIQGGKP